MLNQWSVAFTSDSDCVIDASRAAEERRALKRQRLSHGEVPLTLLTFRGLTPVVLLSVVGQCGTTALLAGHFHDVSLWKLFALMLVFSAARLGVVVAFNARNRETLTQRSAARWQDAYALATLPYCISLGVVTLYNFAYHDLTAKALCIFGVFLICSGLSARVGMRLWATQLCGLLLLGSLAVCIGHAQDPVLAYAGVTLIGFFALAHVGSVKGKYESTVSQLRDQYKLRELSERDALTGLANRRYFQERLGDLCRGSGGFATLFLDLDHFKAVNDTYGHAAGDELLRQVSVRLKQAVRSTDVVARFGGDEFAILQTPIESRVVVEALAERLNQSIHQVFLVHDHEVFIGTSIGIELSTDEGRNPGRLLSAADGALYEAKQMGRGGYRFA